MRLSSILRTLSLVSIVSGFATVGRKHNLLKTGTTLTLLAAESGTEITESIDGETSLETQQREDAAFGLQSSIQSLDAALRSNATAATEILNWISELRSAGNQSQAEGFVDSLVEQIDGVKLPFWSRFRPLTRFSKRARKASLRRVLDLSTPMAEEKESVEDDEEAARRRRRRSFVILLRALAQTDEEESGDQGDEAAVQKNGRKRIAVVQLEKAARRELKSNVEADDMLNRLPPGLETPRYEVLVKRPAGYEIRRYEAFSMCSVSMTKPRPKEALETDAKVQNPQLGGASAFGALAGYLFGKNQESTAMKMTTPVISSGSQDDRQMSFVLPSTYWQNVDQAPSPLSGSGVTLDTDNGGDRATVMFGGFAGKKDVDQRTQQLLNGLAKDKEYQADPDASVTLAQYNDPFTPPWKRRNEVSIKVVPRGN